MTKLERVYQEIHTLGIVLDEFPLPRTVSISHMDDDGDCFIAIDRSRIETSAEEEVRLLHEMGHCETGSFYCRYTKYETRGRLEARATRWSIRKRLPIEELRGAIHKCRPRNDWELAEELGLTVDFVREAIGYYTEALGLPLVECDENLCS